MVKKGSTELNCTGTCVCRSFTFFFRSHPTLYASLSLRGSINGKRILCRFNPKIGRFSCILIIIAINRAIMDHQTGAAGQRPQKLTAKIERMGRWVEVSWRNTGIRLETGLLIQPATVCRPRPSRLLLVSKRICRPIIGPVTTGL